MSVKVLGSGCANCTTLEARTSEALAVLGVAAAIEKVTDYAEIAGYGVMSTPALVVDEQVVVAGRVPSVDEIRTLLSAVREEGPPSDR
ncbi:MAG: thioredoxin family protein [Acidimicrobiia bacterium]